MGTATSCSGLSSCRFQFSAGNLTGWADSYGGTLSFQLPGESKASYNLPYGAHVVSVSGSTDLVNGTFVGADVNTEKVVHGTTSTFVTVKSVCWRVCGTAYVLDNGTITLTPTDIDATLTSLACVPESLTAGTNSSCTVSVTDRANSSVVPTGTVTLRTSVAYVGLFSNGGNCTLVAGSCSFSFGTTDEEVGTIPIVANYAGTATEFASTNTTWLYVSAPPDAGGGGGTNGSYNVSFAETGLLAGSTWTVALQNVSRTTTLPTIVFAVPNGTYDFSVASLAGTPSAPEGTVNVSGAGVFVPETFAPFPNVSIAFLAAGLPPLSSWSATVRGSPNVTLSGEASSFTFAVPPGPVGFSVTPPAGYGLLRLAGTGVRNQTAASVVANSTFRAVFSPAETVFFNESSLPRFEAYPGASWSVVLNPLGPAGAPPPQTERTNGSSIEFTLPARANYRFAISSPGAEYRALPAGGPLHVPLHSSGHVVRFALIASGVIFTESGLPPATNWTLTISNGSSPALSYPLVVGGPGSALRLRLPSGTYAWTVSAGASVASPASGTLVVVAPSVPITVPIAWT